MKSYIFTVELRGFGSTPEEAWQDAVDSFAADPGEPHETIQESDELYDEELPNGDDETETFDDLEV